MNWAIAQQEAREIGATFRDLQAKLREANRNIKHLLRESDNL